MSEDRENSNFTSAGDRNEPRETQYVTEGTPNWVPLAIVALAVLSVVGVGIGWSAASHAKNAEEALATQTKALQQNNEATTQRLAQEEDINAQLQTQLAAISQKLNIEQTDLTTTKRQTSQIKSEYSKKLDSVQTELATKASADDVKTLNGDVSGVKSDLEATRRLGTTRRDEVGNLIANNNDEIDQLRRQGERDYYEFTLTGKGGKSKVGSTMLELRGTNVKKEQFTVALYVDDMRLEKKNRAVDEPIYFYTRGNRTPLELVINEVGKDKAVGYLSVPKAQPQSASASPVAQ